MDRKFRKQFLITDNLNHDLIDFVHYNLHNKYLMVHKEMPVIGVKHNDIFIGYLLGWPIDIEKQKLVRDQYKVNDWNKDDFDASVENYIYCLGGSFIFICGQPSNCRLYLDSNGTLSSVYSAERRIAGATAEITLLDDFDSLVDRDLIEQSEVSNHGWLTAGLTAHKNLSRVMANHYLDLDTFICHRHWPREAFTLSDNPESLAIEVGDEILAVVKALYKDQKVYVTLTAGNETRAILAAIKSVVGAVTFSTLDNPNNNVDHAIAKQLSDAFDLNHVTLPMVKSDEAGSREWDRRVGYCLTGANRIYYPSVFPMSDGITIGGLGGEVGRCFLWPNMRPDIEITASKLNGLLKLPKTDTIINAIQKWLNELPAFLDTAQILDIAYLELRMSTWAYAQTYANPDETIIQPLTSRNQFNRYFAMDYEFRWNNGLIASLINQSWPELNDFPINAYGDWRDAYLKFSRILKAPQHIIPKLRQIVGSKF